MLKLHQCKTSGRISANNKMTSGPLYTFACFELIYQLLLTAQNLSKTGYAIDGRNRHISYKGYYYMNNK